MEAALFPRHAFVDLETTGLDPLRDDVIELGALFVEGGQPVRRISKLFRAKAPLPLAIRRLTGLSDADLTDTAPFSDFLPELTEALRGWTVVAHNAAFERSFLSEVLAEIEAPVLDSCEVLHYLYPELDSHALESVVRWAGVSDKAAHRALKDCEDTFGVMRFALAHAVEDGRVDDLTDVLSCFSGAADSPLTRMFETLRGMCRTQPAPLQLTESSAFLEGKPGRRRQVQASPGGEHPVEAVTAAELEEVLGPGGSLERTEPGFQSRPEQLALATQVARSLTDGGVLAVEAGTGTGKSLAYLAPAALFAARNGWKVAVATHTRALQDQLMEKDLPKLHRATGGAFEYALLKGQTNYLCRRRTLEVTRVDPAMDYDARAARAYLRAYLRRSATGDLDRLSYWFKERFPAVIPLALACRSEAATTLGERCPHYHRCYYHSAVQQAKDADVLVINQALAVAWPPRYPAFRHAVLDEAHELEDVLTSALAVELNGAVLARAADRLSGRQGRGVLAEIARRLEGAGDVARLGEEAVLGLRQAAGELGSAVASLCQPSGAGELFESNRGYAPERRLTPPVVASTEWKTAVQALKAVRERIAALTELLGVRLPSEASNLVTHPGLERDVSGAVAALQEAGALVDVFAQPLSKDQCAFAQLRPERGEWFLCAQPLDVRPAFHDAFEAPSRSLVLCSATLSASQRNTWVLDRLGLERVPLYRSGTPFDLERQGLVVLVTDAPSPTSDAFLDWASDRIGGLAEFMGGRVLGLFASARRLDEVGRRVRERLEPRGIEVLRQSWGNGRALLARQEQDFGSVLLGTKSFWQGVDIRGRGVGCVFIDKLPIEPQSRPIVAAREEVLGGGGGGFARYRLPRALILLRQGVGRLIRSLEDRGVVIIADPGSATYRDEVLAALDGYRVEVLPWAKARRLIRDSLVEMGLRHEPPRAPPAAAAQRAP